MKHGAPIKHRPARTAFAAFVFSLFVFATLIFVSDFVLNTEDTQPIEADNTMGKSRVATLFFHGGDDELIGIVTVTSDTRFMSVQATAYPVSHTVQNGFAEGKSEYAQMLFDREQNVESDIALSFSVDRVADFLVYLGQQITVTLPEPALGLPMGESTLTPDQVTALLRYTEWSAGESGRQRMYAQTVAWLINHCLIPSRNIDTDFAKLTELCDDRLHISQFAVIREELLSLAAENDGSLCRERIHT